MLTFICGDDVVTARNYYNDLRHKYEKDGYEIYDLPAGAIGDINKWINESPTLFGDKKIYFTRGLNAKISKKSNPALYTLAVELSKTKSIEVIDWEESMGKRELKISTGVTIKEFKLSQTIFKLLDSCYPTNLQNFVNQLHHLPKNVDELFIYIMLVRHMRNILIVKIGSNIKSLQSWQIAKLKSQSAMWKVNDLINFYDSLFRLDVTIKTSKNPYSVIKSLDTVACYFL